FNIDDVLDNVLKELLVAERPKLMKLIVLQKAFDELPVIEWTDLGTRHRLTHDEAKIHTEAWETMVNGLQRAVYGDEIATQ
ncbi:hypothetical protein ACSV5T_10260, partial [Veillonella sp. ZSJB6]